MSQGGARMVADLLLRGGHRYSLEGEAGSPTMKSLRLFKEGRQRQLNRQNQGVLHIPLDGGRRNLSLQIDDIIEVELPVSGEHPTMNIEEGHLGGYISGCHPDAARYDALNGDPATWYPALWQWMVETLGVDSLLDVGCGEGHTARYFAHRGCRVSGIDGSVQARRDSVIPDQHVRHDYTTGPYATDQAFSAVWSCEFVEHVEERFVDNFLRSFSCAERYIFLTAALPGQPGWHHVNCREPAYWIDKIQRLGFLLDPALTREARDLAAKGHFARQGLVFTRERPI